MKKIILVLVLLFGISNLKAEETKKTLFEYPQVPDTISTFENRANYLIANFWNNFNFSKLVTDEDALDEAFQDYVQFFRYAHRNVVKSSISNLMNKSQSNMGNFWMIANAAENSLYSADAHYPSDEGYMLFLENILKSTKVKKSEKEKYVNQMQKINKNQIGASASPLEYVDVKGNKKSLYDIKAPLIMLFFNTEDCTDCSLSRLRLSTNVAINKMIADGELTILSITPIKYSKDWAEKAKSYSNNWEIGASDNADKDFDFRVMPNVMLLDEEKRIINKNMNVNDIVNSLNRSN